MKKRIFAGITASILALSCAAQVPAILSASAAGNYEMQLNIKLNGEKKAISPYIYGVNEAGNSTSLKKVTTHSLRQGGNRFTGYNWENNYSNAGRDWNDSSDTNMGDVTDGPAYQARRLSKEAAENNVDYKMATLQMAGYVSADKDYWRHGIGLYVCHQIITAHSGKIWLKSKEGEGTQVFFSLPEEVS